MKKENLALINCIEKTWCRKVVYSKDCNALSDDIYQKISIKISSQTLRRVFGFIKDGVQTSKTTLNLLANYVGYERLEDLIEQYTEDSKFIDPKDVQYIKLFYGITPFKTMDDDNYHNSSKNISKILYDKPELLSHISTFLSQNKAAQVYFFERFPFIDKLSNGYEVHIKKYLNEKVDAEAQLFGNCLLYMGYALANKDKRSEVLHKINEISINDDIHPFPIGRKFACNIFEHFLNGNQEKLDYWIKESLIVANTISSRRKEYNNFPFFQFILADVLNLVERPHEASEIITICELDYKRVTDFNLDNGYLEALDLIKAINLVQQGKINNAKRILARSNSKDILFIMNDYFLIQRLLVELSLIKSQKSTKYQKMQQEIIRLIDQTGFYFFKTKFKYLSN